MNPDSAKALAWAAGLLIVLALVILSPTGAFALLVAAVIGAAVPAAFATKRTRVISLILLVTAVALAASFYPAYKRDREAYVRRAKERAAWSSRPAPER